jgi:hypothetical protein
MLPKLDPPQLIYNLEREISGGKEIEIGLALIFRPYTKTLYLDLIIRPYI